MVAAAAAAPAVGRVKKSRLKVNEYLKQRRARKRLEN